MKVLPSESILALRLDSGVGFIRLPLSAASVSEAEEKGDEEDESPEAEKAVKPTFVPLAPKSRSRGSGPVGAGFAEVKPTTIEEVGEVFVVATVERDGDTDVLGMVPLVSQAENVARGFMADAQGTDVIEIRIDSWTVGRVGPDCVRTEVWYALSTCPVCARATFWVKGENEKAECHERMCRAWLAPNAIDPRRWDCGWPAASDTDKGDDYDDAYENLIEMKGRAAAAGFVLESELADGIAEEI